MGTGTVSDVKKCAVFVGGDRVSRATVDKLMLDGSYIIAADVGYVYARELGIEPDLVIGDFDSAQKPEASCEVYPVRKDDTDIMLALKKAILLGFRDITVVGGTGGRLDHTVGNLQALAYCCEQDVRCRLSADGQRAEIYRPGTYRIAPPEGWSMSLFAFGSAVCGLTIRNADYCADDLMLEPSFPLGISNKALEGGAEVSFKSGRLLCICSEL